MNQNKAGLALFNCGGRKDILDRIAQMDQSSLEIDVMDSVEKALTLIKKVKPSRKTVLIFRVGGRNDLVAAVAVLKAARRQISTNVLRTVALLTVDSVRAEDLLIKHGCREIYSGGLDLEKFFKKLNFWLNSYCGQSMEGANNKELEADILFESEDNLEREVDKILEKRDVANDAEEFLFRKRAEIFSRDGDVNIVDGLNVESGIVETKIRMEGESGSSSVLSCNLESFEENAMDLEIESHEEVYENCAVNVSVRFSYAGCCVDILTAGLIQSFEKLEEGNYILNVKLLKDESQKLENFMAIFQKRQEEINKFMNAAQGKDHVEWEWDAA